MRRSRVTRLLAVLVAALFLGGAGGAADVDALLSRMAAADGPARPARSLALALGGLLVLPAGLLALRRRG